GNGRPRGYLEGILARGGSVRIAPPSIGCRVRIPCASIANPVLIDQGGNAAPCRCPRCERPPSMSRFETSPEWILAPRAARTIGLAPKALVGVARQLGIRCGVIPGRRGRLGNRLDVEKAVKRMEKAEAAQLAAPA